MVVFLSAAAGCGCAFSRKIKHGLPDQELERGLDAMLAAYGNGDMEADAAGPSAPAPAHPPKKKPARPAKKPRATAAATRGAPRCPFLLQPSSGGPRHTCNLSVASTAR